MQSVANMVSIYDRAEFYIFCGDKDLNDIPLEGIRKDEWTQFNPHTKVWYASPGEIISSIFRQISAIQPDVCYVIGVFDFSFNIVPILIKKCPQTILSARGMLHSQALAQKKWKKKIVLGILRVWGIQNKIIFHATDDVEFEHIRRIFGPKAEVRVAGNFPKVIGMPEPIEKVPGILKMATIALISPMKNILKVIEALQEVDGEVEYHIYGPVKETGYGAQCVHLAGQLPPRISVIFHGELPPEEIKTALAQNHIFVLPSKSENFGHAIYEALSAGRPVITSHHTPWNGLEAQYAGFNVDPNAEDELRNAISFFVSIDQSDVAKWSWNAFNFAQNAIDFDQIKGQYDQVFGLNSE